MKNTTKQRMSLTTQTAKRHKKKVPDEDTLLVQNPLKIRNEGFEINTICVIYN